MGTEGAGGGGGPPAKLKQTHSGISNHFTRITNAEYNTVELHKHGFKLHDILNNGTKTDL